MKTCLGQITIHYLNALLLAILKGLAVHLELIAFKARLSTNFWQLEQISQNRHL